MTGAQSMGSSNDTPRVFNDGVKRRKPIEYIVLPNGCWRCTSHVHDEQGYVRVSYKGQSDRLHRRSYNLTKGRIRKGQVIMHLCDNPSCFNPDHLQAGTQKMNMRDMIKKGRNAYIGVKGRGKHGSNSRNEKG